MRRSSSPSPANSPPPPCSLCRRSPACPACPGRSPATCRYWSRSSATRSSVAVLGREHADVVALGDRLATYRGAGRVLPVDAYPPGYAGLRRTDEGHRACAVPPPLDSGDVDVLGVRTVSREHRPDRCRCVRLARRVARPTWSNERIADARNTVKLPYKVRDLQTGGFLFQQKDNFRCFQGRHTTEFFVIFQN